MSDAKNVAVDLDSFIPEDKAVYEVLAQDGIKTTGWKITFAGPSHPKSVEFANERARERLRRQARLEAQQVNGRKVKPEDRDLDDVQRENIGWVISRILDWTPIRAFGREWTFNEKDAIELLMKPEMQWAVAQFIEFLTNDASFIKASATT